MKIQDCRDAVDIVELAWIPVAPGRKLAARLFLPKKRRSKKVPVILEYIPYRRRDGTRPGDDETHIWFAANGYAAARVDIAGMGDSEGLVEDEYVKREQDDALEVIEWLGTQAWCNGNVGMIGISWGGFSGLQIAARRPPRLKAVVTTCSTDDRYECDAHYLGGCLINDNFSWGGAFFNYAALPPDPADGRRGSLARDVEGAHRQSRHVSGRMAETSAPRCILEAWLGLRGFFRDPMPRLRGWRLARRLYADRAPPRRESESPLQGIDRTLGPQAAAARRAGPGHRLPPGMRPLVGSVSERHRSRCRQGSRDTAVAHGAGGTAAAFPRASGPLARLR